MDRPQPPDSPGDRAASLARPADGWSAAADLEKDGPARFVSPGPQPEAEPADAPLQTRGATLASDPSPFGPELNPAAQDLSGSRAGSASDAPPLEGDSDRFDLQDGIAGPSQRQLHPLPRGLVELYGLLAVLFVLVPEWMAGSALLGFREGRRGTDLPAPSGAWKRLPELRLASLNLAELRLLALELGLRGYGRLDRDTLTREVLRRLKARR